MIHTFLAKLEDSWKKVRKFGFDVRSSVFPCIQHTPLSNLCLGRGYVVKGTGMRDEG